MNAHRDEAAEYPREDESLRDGIGEEDNPIPTWFNAGFYGSIAFGIVYVFYYTLSGWSSHGQWEAQVAAARAQRAAVEVALPSQNPYRNDAAAVKEGGEIFHQICAACHKPDASGLVGPSLVDPYFKYGGSDAELFETVANGRPGGMPAWKAVLGTEKIWKVLAYIATLPKSDKPGVGAPGYTPPTAAGS